MACIRAWVTLWVGFRQGFAEKCKCHPQVRLLLQDMHSIQLYLCLSWAIHFCLGTTTFEGKGNAFQWNTLTVQKQDEVVWESPFLQIGTFFIPSFFRPDFLKACGSKQRLIKSFVFPSPFFLLLLFLNNASIIWVPSAFNWVVPQVDEENLFFLNTSNNGLQDCLAQVGLKFPARVKCVSLPESH